MRGVSRHIGKFQVSADVVESGEFPWPASMFPLRCEYFYGEGIFDVTACWGGFAYLAFGVATPEYSFEIILVDDIPTLKFWLKE